MRRRDIVFILLVAVFIAGGLSGRVLAKVTDDAGTSAWNFFEGHLYTVLPDPSFESLSSGEFQSVAETWVAEKVPMRREVLLAHAGAERWVIEAANVPFGYPVYPTFYGSSYLDCRGADAVYQLPLSRADYDADFFSRVGAWAGGLVSAAPEAQWVFALPDRSNVSVAVPAAGLVSDHADWAYLAGGLRESLPAGVTVLELSHDDLGEYQRAFFRTDHHWQVTGALEAYRQIVELAGAVPVEIGEPAVATEEPFYGSGDRVGLCPDAYDQLYDVEVPEAHFTVMADGEESSAAELGGIETWGSDWSKGGNKYADVYDDWFPNTHQVVEVTNEDLPEEAGSLLVIGDSYSNVMTRLLARSFKHVYVVDPRSYTGDLAQYIAEKNPDHVAFIMCAETLVAVAR